MFGFEEARRNRIWGIVKSIWRATSPFTWREVLLFDCWKLSNFTNHSIYNIILKRIEFLGDNRKSWKDNFKIKLLFPQYHFSNKNILFSSSKKKHQFRSSKFLEFLNDMKKFSMRIIIISKIFKILNETQKIKSKFEIFDHEQIKKNFSLFH